MDNNLKRTKTYLREERTQHHSRIESEVKNQKSRVQTLWVGYLNEAQLRPQFRKSLNLQSSSLVGSFKKNKCFICSNETVHDKWCSHENVRQTENGV